MNKLKLGILLLKARVGAKLTETEKFKLLAYHLGGK